MQYLSHPVEEQGHHHHSDDHMLQCHNIPLQPSLYITYYYLLRLDHTTSDDDDSEDDYTVEKNFSS